LKIWFKAYTLTNGEGVEEGKGNGGGREKEEERVNNCEKVYHYN
jgi:hypothetical protein